VNRFWQVLGLACSVAIASAQTPVRKGSYEIGGFMGASYGVGEGAVMGGGNVSYALTKEILPYVEYSYLPNVQRTTNGFIGGTQNPATATYGANVSDFHVGVHIRFQIRENRHFAPYAAFGVGSLTVGSGTIHTLNYTDTNGPHSLTGLNLNEPGGSNVAINYGGGIRYYVTPQKGSGNARYGFRIEVKGYKPFSQQGNNPFGGSGTVTFNNSFVKAEAGFFLQLK
jgi:hypothetical protein